MAGNVNNPSKRREKLLLRPVEDGKWEAWALDDAAPAVLAKTCALPDEAQPSSQSVLALPVRQLFAVPLWLATSDPALMRDMIFLQLERRGLAGRSAQDAVFDYQVVSAAENQTLVLAVSLPGNLPPHLCPAQLRNFEPSALTYALPPDGFTIWIEDDRLVLAVTNGPRPVYFQALGEHGFVGLFFPFQLGQIIRAILLELGGELWKARDEWHITSHFFRQSPTCHLLTG